MSENLRTDYVHFQLSREETRWYHTFTEHWTLSVAIDADPKHKAIYNVRVVGPQGEVCKSADIPADEAPKDVRASFDAVISEVADSL